jgi:hypothetical protein
MMLLANHGLIIMYESPYHPDALAFFNAVAAEGLMLDTTIKNAINTMVVDLHNNSLWGLFHAIYPMVGGDARGHKYNLKDPRDLDAAFRLRFYSDVGLELAYNDAIHTAIGVEFQGSKYAITHYYPSVSSTQDSAHMGVYINNNTNAPKVDMGTNAGGGVASRIITRFNDNNTYNGINGGVFVSGASTDSRGHQIVSRTGPSTVHVIKNGTLTISSSDASTGLSIYPILLGAWSVSGTPTELSDRHQSLAHIGDGLSDAQCATWYTIVQAFQTALSRNV